MIFAKSVPERKVIASYVTLINGILDLTTRQQDILIELIKIDLSWTDKRRKDVTDPLSRKQIMKETLVNKNNLSRYIKKFKDDGILIVTEDGCIVNPSLVPSELHTTGEIELLFKIKLEEDGA